MDSDTDVEWNSLEDDSSDSSWEVSSSQPPARAQDNLEMAVSTSEGTSNSLIESTHASPTASSCQAPGPVCPGSSSVCPVGGSVSINTAHETRQASGDEVLQIVGAFVKEAEKSDFDCTLVRRDEGHSKEVHVHLMKTDIHQPTAVSFGGQVLVGSPPQSSAQTHGPTVYLQKLRETTEKTFKEWTEGMLMTNAARTILNKIDQGITWVTVTGCPGEGKTTAGYLVLKHFHDRGREVFDVKTPDDYFKAKEVKHPVIMLNDIFGSLTFDSDSFKKWQNVLSDVLALSEHKHEERNRSNKTQNHKKPELTVILISRLSILKEASSTMGRFKHLVLKDENLVDLTEMIQMAETERMAIWKCHANQYDISIDTRIVRDVCKLTLSHGFPHCCRLFAAIYKKNNTLNMRNFFSKPLEFLNQSMESLLFDSLTGSLLREMLKNDGTLNLESIADDEQRNKYFTVAKTLMGTYLVLNDRKIEFHHPSVYDSAAFCICQVDPQFVISFCSLSFLNERVRLKDLTPDDTIQGHNTVSVDKTFENTLLERFLKEFHSYNISAVLSHASFHDDGFVSKFIQKAFSSSTRTSKLKHVEYKVSKFMHTILPSTVKEPISKYLKGLFHVCDIQSKRSFLFLMTKSGSDKLLRYVHQYVELTEDEQKETLFGICEHSSVSSLEYLLQKYKNINLEVEDQDYRRPLLICSQKGSQEMIRQLLTRNVNVNAMDYEGRTPLLNICRHGVDGDGSVVRMLIEKGADSTLTGRQFSQSPLFSASTEGHTNVVKALLDVGVNVNTSDFIGDTPLITACWNGHADVVSALLNKGADINTTNMFGDTPLHAACCKGPVNVVSILLNNGANMNATNGTGNTPLQEACSEGHVDVVSILVDKGAINTANSNVFAFLHAACQNGQVDVVSVLLKKGAVINTKDHRGDTLLHAALKYGNVDAVPALLEMGADINSTDQNGDTPLHTALKYGQTDVVSTLLDKGADVNKSNNKGDTSLHRACRRGHMDVISALIDKGADVKTTNMFGDTPLHAACCQGHVDTVSILLNNGANMNVTNSIGNTPLQVACSEGHVDVVSALLEKGADNRPEWSDTSSYSIEIWTD